MDLIKRGKLNPVEFTSGEMALEQLPAAFGLARGKDKSVVKRLIRIADD